MNSTVSITDSVISDVNSIAAKAPAKLILSGEHAVVYGFPSIAMAIDLYAISEVAKNKHNLLGFDFANLKYNAKHTLNTISKLKDKAFIDYQRFLRGECSIREVVNKPFELLQFAVSHFLDKLNITLPGGIDIKTHSNIPTGSGLGSSAATIMSLLYAVGHLLNLNLSKARYIELGKTAENLQHGKSSGLDITLTVEGGCMKYENGHLKNIEISTSNMYLINTGRPLVTTGECVSKVKKFFSNNSANGSNLGYEFAELTTSLEKELVNNNIDQTILIIRENHRLLNHIGVVPHKVNMFIDEVQQIGAAAKVCGAGAVAGDNAGAVLAMCPSQDNVFSLQKLIANYGYTMQAITLDNHGIRII